MGRVLAQHASSLEFYPQRQKATNELLNLVWQSMAVTPALPWQSLPGLHWDPEQVIV